ncbi:hypothetical protein HMPREF0497_0086 [Lentilactobacillus buchneri ATCC 11577]|nr:hypothetical protein HMPREF0497_0086 [Lentilactobacillus buchneri ATCC 11577]
MQTKVIGLHYLVYKLVDLKNGFTHLTILNSLFIHKKFMFISQNRYNLILD